MFDRKEILIQKAGKTDICATCKYYKEYYIKIKNVFGLQTIEANEGVCCRKKFKRMYGYRSCENWEKKD